MFITKEQLKQYARNRHDLTIEHIASDLRVSQENLESLQKLLAELEKEEWLTSIYCNKHKAIEYDPGVNQNNIDAPKEK